MGVISDFFYEEGRQGAYAQLAHKYILKHRCSIQKALNFLDIPSEDAPEVFKLVNKTREEAGMPKLKSLNHIPEQHLSLGTRLKNIFRFEK